MVKKIISVLTAAIIISLPSITTMAATVEADDATGYTQKVVSQNIIGNPSGSAALISDDDPLLDGHFYNGELVNGSICNSKNEAEQVLAYDRAHLNTINNTDAANEDTASTSASNVYPVTGKFVGIDNDGNFFFTIHSSGSNSGRYSAASEMPVQTKAQLYNESSDNTYTNDNQSYIVTLTGPNGVVGSYRGYADNVRGGLTFSTSGVVGVYNVKVAVSGLSKNVYLNGSGSIDF
nr:hypothetical protein [uncultured Clostridium sp.]